MVDLANSGVSSPVSTTQIIVSGNNTSKTSGFREVWNTLGVRSSQKIRSASAALKRKLNSGGRRLKEFLRNAFRPNNSKSAQPLTVSSNQPTISIKDAKKQIKGLYGATGWDAAQIKSGINVKEKYITEEQQQEMIDIAPDNDGEQDFSDHDCDSLNSSKVELTIGAYCAEIQEKHKDSPEIASRFKSFVCRGYPENSKIYPELKHALEQLEKSYFIKKTRIEQT
jgi:hypothetical protein